MYEFVSGEIYWLEVGYQDNPSESKIRPAINDPPKYFDQFKIPILNWRRAGLLKPSGAQGLRLINLTKDQMQSVVKEEDYIGRMDEIDFNYLVSELERIHSS